MKTRLKKSHYKLNTISKKIELILMIILILLVVICIANVKNIVYLYCFISINMLYIMYFFIKLVYIVDNIKQNNAILTKYSEKILRRYKIFFPIYTVYMLLFCMISIYVKVNFNNNIEVWIWFGLQMPMMYCDAVYLSGITAFGDKAYCSGVFVIKYSIIKEFKEIMYKSTYSGEMVLIDVLSSKGVLGYDKFFVEEYHELRLKVFQNNS